MKKTVSIFIIEDDTIFAQMLSDLILSLDEAYNKKGIKIQYKTFYSSEEAMFEMSLKPDIVLLDYFILDDNLEIQTADNIISKIKSGDSKIQIIVVSGQENDLIKHSLIAGGALDYIQKDAQSIPMLEMRLVKLIDSIIQI